jgi:spore germination protein KA
MLRWIKRKLEYSKLERKEEFGIPDQPVSKVLSKNITYISELFEKNSDILFRRFTIGRREKVGAFLVALEGLYDKTAINENIIKPLMELETDDHTILLKRLETIEQDLLSISDISTERMMRKSVSQLLKGDPIMFIDGMEKVYILGSRAWEMRGIQEPVTETVVRGPREGFVETLRTNTAMLRRKIHNRNLIIEQMTLGTLSQTDVAVAYIDHLVNPDILDEVKNRLKRINTDAILESGYVEEFIEDAPYSPFPTVSNTERPDVVSARLLEGRIAILVDGTSTVLVVPYLMMESFQAAEDYYSRPYYASFLRILRLVGFLVSTLAPAAYVAFQNFHQETFPTELLISLSASRQGVPFPLFIEVFIMIISFEWLREAGIRMPRHVGQAVSIVGALVLGESAVNAGFVGAPTVIVVAISAITSFIITPLNDSISILRLLYLFAAGFLGIYGVMLALIFFLLHVASLRSFGVPYMSPWFPISWNGWKDFLIRAPFWLLNRRPEALHTLNELRQTKDNKPRTGKKQEGGDRF